MKLRTFASALATGLLAASAVAQPAPPLLPSDAWEFKIAVPKKTDALTHEFQESFALVPACTGKVQNRQAAAVEVRSASKTKALLRGDFEAGDTVALSCKLTNRRN